VSETDEWPRLIHAIRELRGRKDQPEGFGWKDYRDPILRARTQLGGPVVPVRDNLRMRPVMPPREFFETGRRQWTAVGRAPTSA
jgi:hypothetical protein